MDTQDTVAPLTEGATPDPDQQRDEAAREPLTPEQEEAAEADFAAGFAETRGDEPPASSEAPKDEGASGEAPPADPPQQAAAPKPVAPADPNAKLKDELRQEIFAQLTPQLRALDGRIGGINRDLKN